MNIYKHTNSILTSITYVLYIPDLDNVWLVDCGDADEIIKWIESNKKIISGVFLTHTHYDHIYGLNKLKKVIPDFKVYTSADGIKGLYDPKLNMSFFHTAFYHDNIDSYIFKFNDVYELKEYDKIELWLDIELDVLETKGHDRSCLTYKVDNYLFTGDSYIPGIKVVTNLPKSNKADAEKSLNKILSLQKKDNLIICPGHSLIV
jgi:glyoxylase-like metal-dependent hydrolase (beta-lactamase superfamily II)